MFIMSLFKMFGNGNGSRPKGDKNEISRDSGIDNTPKRAPVPAEEAQEVMDPDEAEARAAAAQLDLPFRSGKKSRNLSISRSGRHRYRKNQRASVASGEVFSSPSSPDSPSGPQSSSGSYCRTPSDCRDSNTSHGSLVQTHTPMARTPTAV